MLQLYMDRFQKTLYTRVLVHITKRMKNTHFTLHIPPSHFFPNYPTTPRTYSKMKRAIYIFKIPKVDGETRTTVLSCILGEFGSNQKLHLSHCRALVFFFLLVHTQVRQVKSWYIIIYTMKKHILSVSLYSTFLGFYLCKNSMSRQEIFKITKMYYDKIHK